MLHHSSATKIGVDRFMDEQMFEEDVRAVMMMLRPHRDQRLQGWHEYRTGGAHFRATVSWDEEFHQSAPTEKLMVPRMADVLEAILVGSARAQDELTADEE